MSVNVCSWKNVTKMCAYRITHTMMTQQINLNSYVPVREGAGHFLEYVRIKHVLTFTK